MFNISSIIFVVGMLLLIIGTMNFLKKKDFSNNDKLMSSFFIASIILITSSWVIKNTRESYKGNGIGRCCDNSRGDYNSSYNYANNNDYNYYSQFSTGDHIIAGTVFATDEALSETGGGLGWVN
jgi:hypothetical protein